MVGGDQCAPPPPGELPANSVRGALRLQYRHASALNGNTLIAYQSTQQVCEVDRENNTVHTLAIGKPAYTARRLVGGHTLVGGRGFLYRFDNAGKKIRELDVTFVLGIEHY